MLKYECDSRKVQIGQIFVAIKGQTVDGHDYIDEAIKNGASAVIGERDLNLKVPYTKVKNSEHYLKLLLDKDYKDKLKRLKIIGITGTNGKTTTGYLTYQMLNLMGIGAAYIGTLGYYSINEHIELDNTTPDTLTIYKLLINAYEKGITYIVMEVSSQALAYNRIYGINFNFIAFTNLTEDHLDYHKTMENYLNAKLKILDHLKKGAIIFANKDDENYIHFKKDGYRFKTIGYDADYNIVDYTFTPTYTTLNFQYLTFDFNVSYPLTSKFNVYNYLTMLAIVNRCGYDIPNIINASKFLKAPKGRCEGYNVKDAYAVIDYAHTPDAVEKVITAYNELKKGKVITLIGCGGDRDSAKRPIMGDIATKLSDYVILTSDNPRTEDPNKIIDDIVKGIKTNNYEIEIDRKKAIKKGLDMLNKDDILLILGKGHEDYQIIGKTKHHLDDAEEVLNYIKND